MDKWDPRRLRLPGATLAAPSGGRPTEPRRRRGAGDGAAPFIKGPLPVVWLGEARKLGVSALWVGLGLWYLRGLKRSSSVVVSNVMMRDWGVSGDAKSRALRALEAAGLITIERRGKRSPRVTIVAPPSWEGGRARNEATVSI
jgi:hypothetical protein